MLLRGQGSQFIESCFEYFSSESRFHVFPHCAYLSEISFSRYSMWLLNDEHLRDDEIELKNILSGWKSPIHRSTVWKNVKFTLT